MISIVIPAYNEELLIVQSVRSVHEVLESHGIAHEIIVAANGCTDATIALVQTMTLREPWCRLVSVPVKAPGEAFKHAVMAARGTAIATLDADLSVDTDFVINALPELERSVMVVGSKRAGRQTRPYWRVDPPPIL
jgi:glycosyltransferase involved in cell wall biosynthesis